MRDIRGHTVAAIPTAFTTQRHPHPEEVEDVYDS
jgi:hypothetical protein